MILTHVYTNMYEFNKNIVHLCQNFAKMLKNTGDGARLRR